MYFLDKALGENDVIVTWWW